MKKKIGILVLLALALAGVLAAQQWFINYQYRHTTMVMRSVIVSGTTRHKITTPEISRHSDTAVNVPGLAIGGTLLDATPSELNVLDGVTPGTVTASKAVVVDGSKDIGTFGTVSAASFSASGGISAGSDSTIGGDLDIDAALDVGTNAVVAGTLEVTGATTMTTATAGPLLSGAGNSTPNAQVTNDVTEYGDAGFHKTVVDLSNVSITMNDSAGIVAWGCQEVVQLPSDYVFVWGVSFTGGPSITKSSAGINDDFDGDIGIGTGCVDGADASMLGDEDDLFSSVATPQAVSGTTDLSTAVADSMRRPTVNFISRSVYLNVFVDDTDHDVTSTAADLDFDDGYLTILWSRSGPE